MLKAAADEVAAAFGTTDALQSSCPVDVRIKPELAPPFLELAAVAYDDVTENTTAILRSESGWRLAPELWSASHSPLDTRHRLSRQSLRLVPDLDQDRGDDDAGPRRERHNVDVLTDEDHFVVRADHVGHGHDTRMVDPRRDPRSS